MDAPILHCHLHCQLSARPDSFPLLKLLDLSTEHPTFPAQTVSPAESSQISVEELRRQVKQQAEQGDYWSAIALLDQIIEQSSDSALDYNNRGLMYFQIGEYSQALADYDQAIVLNPQLDRVYNNRANCHAALENWAGALADYEMALDLNPVNLRAWINQGITFRQMGLYGQAIDNLCFALRWKRLTGQIYAERGRTYHLWGDWNCAIADYHQALESLPFNHPLRMQVVAWMNELLHPATA